VDSLTTRLRTRFVPAVLTALGVAFLTMGLLTYSTPVEAGPEPSQSPTIVTLPPTPTPTVTPRPSGTEAPTPTDTPAPTFPADRGATRIVISALGIDLPIVRPPSDSAYPLCDVAMFIKALGQPGQGWATYLYAHARTGMFLPILDASKVDNGSGMLGMVVEVYTSDDQLFLYEITEVRRHQLDLDDAVAADHEQLWLQTSEGPKGTKPKTQVVAEFLSSGAADHDAAHPTPHPKVCG
jgi:hypothetical protein